MLKPLLGGWLGWLGWLRSVGVGWLGWLGWLRSVGAGWLGWLGWLRSVGVGWLGWLGWLRSVGAGWLGWLGRLRSVCAGWLGWLGWLRSVGVGWLGVVGMALLAQGCPTPTVVQETPTVDEKKPQERLPEDGGLDEPAPDAPKPVCIGVVPQAESPEPTPPKPEPCGRPEATCPGSLAPSWSLLDFQPQSCGYKQRYGLRSFRGTVTLVALLSAWCSFCRSQAEYLERMRLELGKEGKPFHLVVLNSIDAASETDQKLFVDLLASPLFQDTEETKAWEGLAGQKDDFYIYDRDGRLAVYLTLKSDTPMRLATPEGYKAVKDAILSVR